MSVAFEYLSFMNLGSRCVDNDDRVSPLSIEGCVCVVPVCLKLFHTRPVSASLEGEG